MIYLAGPINGCTDDEANNWRDLVKRAVGAENCLDPMRRDYRGKEDESVDEIVHGDIADIDLCDIMIANCWQVSWGTAMEMFYAARTGLWVVAVLPPAARVSPWLRYHSEVVYSLDEAIKLAGEPVPGLEGADSLARTTFSQASLARYVPPSSTPLGPEG